MIKPDLLRTAIVAGLPDFATDPDRLLVFIDKGRIATRLTTAGGFEYRYTLNLVLLGLTAHPDAIMVIVTDWMRVHQPDLLLDHTTGESAIRFEADILDSRSCDLSIELDLREAVRIRPRAEGGFDLVHLPEPPIETMLGEIAPGIGLREIWLDGARLVPDLARPAS